MKPLDKLIQILRIQKAGRHIAPNSCLLDIGCADGAIFRHLRHKIQQGVGIDPNIIGNYQDSNYQLIRGNFPQDLPAGVPIFDTITMLAVLEHISVKEQPILAANIFKHLRPGGKLLITVPAPIVDKILEVLKLTRLIDGMSLDEHYGFDFSTVRHTFSNSGLVCIKHERFQFGLNNLFVFQKT